MACNKMKVYNKASSRHFHINKKKRLTKTNRNNVNYKGFCNKAIKINNY